MAKKALCVGINDYPYKGNDLNGCVNDALAWAELLINHFGFSQSDVNLLINNQATKAAILAGLQALLDGAKAGDVLVFTNSSHGTYLADTSGDEKYDEALCPYDCDDNLLVDDELRELFATVPDGVRLTIISDSCFSGTVTRAPLSEGSEHKLPDDRRPRFLSPEVFGGRVLDNMEKAKPKDQSIYPESGMKEVLLSGCTDKESSYDANIGGNYHGAMSYFALQVIEIADYKITFQQLCEQVNFLLDDAGYPQHPQLEGSADNKTRLIFS